jgi:uncharacterized protein (DUF2461 family)
MATYFPGEALKFLRRLKRNNDRVWFEARKDVYERELKAQAKIHEKGSAREVVRS